MFPIMSVTGDVLGFGGRTLSDQEPKYLNSPESEVFSKGRILFGLHATAKHIRSQDEAYVVEGYMDCLALYQFGIKNVVATLGTALTADHAKALKKLCNKVVVVFDGDEAGKRASEKSLPVLLEADLHARCLTLRDEYDPDEFLREHGTEEFLKEAGKAPDHFIAFLNGLTASFRGAPTEKIEILNSVEPVLSRVTDRRLRSFYQHEVIDRLSLPPQWQPTMTAAKTPQNA
jgi:DNA primase